MTRILALLLLLSTTTIFANDLIQNFAYDQISSIQSKMHKQECFVIYEGGKAKLITNKKISGFTIDLKQVSSAMSKIQQEVELFQKNPFEHNPSRFLNQSQKLYRQLLLPMEADLKKRIHILADTSYAMIPWNALVNNENQYLLNNHEVTIKKTLTQKKSTLSKKNILRLMVIAPQFKKHLALQSEEEKSRILDYVNEVESTFSTCDILHISSHGIINSEDSRASKILISDQSSISSAEISDLCIDAALVFLNICEGGRKSKDQGSIVDAFDMAGAETTIGALWEVDDYMAVEVSDLFYHELFRGQRSGEALRNGLIEYQKNCELSSELHPLKWAGYQVYGENNEIIEEQLFGFKKVLSMILSMLTSFSLISFYFGRKILARIKFFNWI